MEGRRAEWEEGDLWVGYTSEGRTKRAEGTE
jgi:hypothetical protein